MDKRGQFFLLAAVIISSVIISLGVGTNRAVVNNEPVNFYDFGYEVSKEVGAVLDYEVYSGFAGSDNLTEFVGLLAKEIEERSPGSEFLFIYGENATDMEVKNYGSESVYANGMEIEGLRNDIPSIICMGLLCQEIDGNVTDFRSISPQDRVVLPREENPDDNILISIGGNYFDFPTGDHRQVIFVMQKNVEGDRYVIVE